MTLLITWHDTDPATPLSRTTNPDEIAEVYQSFGGRFERVQVRPGVSADTSPEDVLHTYRGLIDGLVESEGFVTVDVAGLHPSDDPAWPDTAKAVRGKFIDEHT